MFCGLRRAVSSKGMRQTPRNSVTSTLYKEDPFLGPAAFHPTGFKPCPCNFCQPPWRKTLLETLGNPLAFSPESIMAPNASPRRSHPSLHNLSVWAYLALAFIVLSVFAILVYAIYSCYHSSKKETSRPALTKWNAQLDYRSMNDSQVRERDRTLPRILFLDHPRIPGDP